MVKETQKLIVKTSEMIKQTKNMHKLPCKDEPTQAVKRNAGLFQDIATLKLQSSKNMQRILLGRLEWMDSYTKSMTLLENDRMSNLFQVSQGELLNSLNSIGTNLKVEKTLKGYLRILNNMGVAESILQSDLSQIFKSLSGLSDNIYEQLLLGTNYTKSDVLHDIGDIATEYETVSELCEHEKLNVYERMEKNEQNFIKKHPVLFIIFLIISQTMGMISTVNDVNMIVRPMFQDLIVYTQGKTDIYYVKADVANIYDKPSSCIKTKKNTDGSTVLECVCYGEQVEKIQDVKMWVKVCYTDCLGNKLVGWIAKKNLISYADYQFNSDALCDM